MIGLMIPAVSTIFRHLCERRFGNAEGCHAERNYHAGECKSDAAQTLLLSLTA